MKRLWLVAGLWDGEDLGGNDEMDTADAMTKDVLVDGIVKAVCRISIGLTMHSGNLYFCTDLPNYRDLLPPSRPLHLPTGRSQSFRPQAAIPLRTGTPNDPFRTATRLISMTRGTMHLRLKGPLATLRPH